MSWWARLFRRQRLDARLDAELRDHVDRQIADYVRAGLSEAEARRKTALSFGGVEQVKEDCRDARGTRWVDEIAQDVRYGLRVLRASPSFTLVAVLSLALGIGANTAIFSLVDTLLLRALPVKEPSRLALVSDGSWTNPIWEAIRDRAPGRFDGAAAWGGESFNLARGGPSELVRGLWVNGQFFDTFGVPAMLGRTFAAADDRRGGGPDGAVTVISYAFWQQRFGGTADVIGRTLTMDAVPFTIVGVTPPEFFGPSVGSQFDVAVPIGTEPIVRGQASSLDKRSTWWLNIVVRLKPDQNLATGSKALQSVQGQIRAATLPDRWPAQELASYLKEPLQLESTSQGPAWSRQRYERPLLTILAVVGLVLLIACANIANLLLARAAGRSHEMSVRLALGASRGRLARQLLVESLLLSAAGAALGLLFAQWGSRMLVRQLSTARDTVFLDLSLDWRILAFTAAVAVATALLFGLAPALRAGRVEPTDALKEQGRTVAGEGRRPVGSPLVVAQVALSLVIVVAAGLFIRTFMVLANMDIGFDREGVLLVDVNIARTGIDEDQRLALYERVREAAATAPGVARAALSIITPVSGAGWNSEAQVPGGNTFTGRDGMVFLNAITPGWFATYGTTLLHGRDVSPNDRPGAPRIAIVNETFAKKFLNGANPVGRVVQRKGGPGEESWESDEIVGLVEDAAYRSLREVPPVVYVPLAQPTPPQLNLAVRTAGPPPAQLASGVAAAIAKVDSRLELAFRPLGEQVSSTLVQERLVAMLSGFFGALALLLASIGLYGVASYAVTRRRTEIAVRVALGADAAGVVRLVLGRVALLVGLGIVVGAAISLWAAKFVSTLLYGLQPRDPLTLGGAIVALFAVGLLAGWLPARRAARIDAASVLREG